MRQERCALCFAFTGQCLFSMSKSHPTRPGTTCDYQFRFKGGWGWDLDNGTRNRGVGVGLGHPGRRLTDYYFSGGPIRALRRRLTDYYFSRPGFHDSWRRSLRISLYSDDGRPVSGPAL